jgi:hypothetical protein
MPRLPKLDESEVDDPRAFAFARVRANRFQR